MSPDSLRLHHYFYFLILIKTPFLLKQSSFSISVEQDGILLKLKNKNMYIKLFAAEHILEKMSLATSSPLL